MLFAFFSNPDQIYVFWKRSPFLMMKFTFKKLLAGMLAAALMIAAAGCGKSESSSEAPSESSEPSSSQVSSEAEPEDLRPEYLFVNPLDPAGIIVPGEKPVLAEKYDLTTKVQDARAINTDVGAYLYSPDTTIDEPVLTASQYGSMGALQKIYDKTSNRLNWKKEGTGLGGTGVAYLHNYANIDSREELTYNTVIFGHNTGMIDGVYNKNVTPQDLPDGPMFAQLYKFLDEDFAKNHPYIYFSTETENFVYQIFGVYWTEANPQPAYWSSKLNSADALVNAKSAAERSQWIYEDVELNAGDKFLTLSTCTYSYTADLHAAEAYRYVVIGKLLEEDAIHRPTANITKNPSPKEPQV